MTLFTFSFFLFFLDVDAFIVGRSLNYFDIYHLYEFSGGQNKYNLNMQDIEKVFTQNESMQNDCELDVRII